MIHAWISAAVRACTSSTRRPRSSGSVAGRTPWPRLKMWPGRPSARGQHVAGGRLDVLPRPEQRGGIEVSLHAAVVPDLLPAAVERDAPVEADHVPSGLGHLPQEGGRPGAEVDRRHVDGGEDPGRVGRGEPLVVGRRQRADPRVEDLDHVGAGAHLPVHVAGEGVGELVQQRVPDGGLAVHHRLHLRELAARLALDQVAGHGERAPAEADDGLVGVELRAHQAYRLEHERARLLRLGRGQALDVGHGLDRASDHRADVLDQVDLDAHADDREHDVREHHRGVDAVPAHRLEGHLRAELGLRGRPRRDRGPCGSLGTRAATARPGA